MSAALTYVKGSVKILEMRQQLTFLYWTAVLMAELPLAGDGWRRKEDFKFEHTVHSDGITENAQCNDDQRD